MAMPMCLPPELMAYAENIYRRFPEEFFALGCPGLEEIFDLRPHGGSMVRVMHETSVDKTVSITLRRWPAGPAPYPGMYGSPAGRRHPMPMPPPPPYGYGQAAGPHHAAYMHGQMPGAMPPYPYNMSAPPPGVPGAPPAPSSPPASVSAPPASASRAAPGGGLSEQATARLLRLEAAISALKPQVEAVLMHQVQAAAASQQPPQQLAADPRQVAAMAAAAAAQAQAQAQMQQAQAQQAQAQAAAAAAAVAAGQAAQAAHAAQSAKGDGVASPLRSRRNLEHLAITAPHLSKAAEKALESQAQPAAAVNGMAGVPSTDTINTVVSGATTARSAATSLAPAPVLPPAGQTMAATAPASSTAAAKAAAPKAQGEEAAPKRLDKVPRPKVEAVRHRPALGDPESPRSPGRYSVWK
eukprot:TRINITY_DN110775_c0_g1_i1.p1 TRINITY_DN110775_c0_g1~~TRINITY_DN110775_c0_g1_i1.p1  ORF type:complete len:411 (+),score=96.44 TRINITY_DN110775_c0_g1_i1:84-1316(+)